VPLHYAIDGETAYYQRKVAKRMYCINDIVRASVSKRAILCVYCSTPSLTRGQSNLTKSASRGAHSPVRGHPRGSKVVPLNSWGRVSY